MNDNIDSILFSLATVLYNVDNTKLSDNDFRKMAKNTFEDILPRVKVGEVLNNGDVVESLRINTSGEMQYTVRTQTGLSYLIYNDRMEQYKVK